MEEYASESILESLDIEYSDMEHIEYEEWQIVKQIYEGKSCKKLIGASRGLKRYDDSIDILNESLRSIQDSLGATRGVMELAESLKSVSENILKRGLVDEIQRVSKKAEAIADFAKITEPLSTVSKLAEPLSIVSKPIEPLSQMSQRNN